MILGIRLFVKAKDTSTTILERNSLEILLRGTPEISTNYIALLALKLER